MEEKIFAPVLIPTLNRYIHFKRCLESLEKCTGHEYTEVFVAVDFPPTPKYEKGWREINDYLINKEKSHNFKKLHVIRRERNYGVCKNNSNSSNAIKNYIFPLFDRYIFTEDDNEFSPNFLEYMNFGLELSSDSSHCIDFISGYTHIDMDLPANYGYKCFKSKAFSAWGYGVLKNKQLDYERYRNFECLKNILRDKKLCDKIENAKPGSVRSIMGMVKRKEIIGDTLHSIYMILENKYCLFPTISKVKNYGSDGTGVHSIKVNQSQLNTFLSQDIDSNTTFNFVEFLRIDQFPEFSRKIERQKSTSLRMFVKKMIFNFDLFLFRMTGITIDSKYI